MVRTLYKFINNEGYLIYTATGEIKSQVYPIPTLNEDGSYTPGAWVEPRDGVLEKYPDASECGAHRLHLMKSIDATYAPPQLWRCYTAEGDGLVGESGEKVSYRRVRLLAPVDIAKLAREGRFRGVNLNGAYLRWAYLRGADFGGVDLQKSDLRESNLQKVNLQGANLQGADLRVADLRGANLRRTWLLRANIRGADLRGANLQRIFFWKTNLLDADIRGADLRGAYLTKEQERYAILEGATV